MLLIAKMSLELSAQVPLEGPTIVETGEMIMIGEAFYQVVVSCILKGHPHLEGNGLEKIPPVASLRILHGHVEEADALSPDGQGERHHLGRLPGTTHGVLPTRQTAVL
jgi:hypothetical protein